MLQVRIVKEDGAIGLFRGAGPTVVRAMALNMGMLASNDEASSRTLCNTCESRSLPLPVAACPLTTTQAPDVGQLFSSA